MFISSTSFEVLKDHICVFASFVKLAKIIYMLSIHFHIKIYSQSLVHFCKSYIMIMQF